MKKPIIFQYSEDPCDPRVRSRRPDSAARAAAHEDYQEEFMAWYRKRNPTPNLALVKGRDS